MTLPNVCFVRPELSRMIGQYNLIRDCISGEVTIKSLKTLYLPMPNASDKSIENKARYEAYVMRALFYNVSRRTLSGLVGQVFMREPEIKVPTLLENVLTDATGTGVTITQQAKKSVSLTLAYSRSGLFVDYPTSPAGATIEELEKGNIKPVVKSYSPLEIVNWRTISVGSKEKLSLVVLDESYCNSDDGFEMKNSRQYRVLKLVKNQYIQEIWREKIPTDLDKGRTKALAQDYQVHEILPMLGANGEPLDEIPFTFLGSENNDTMPDDPNFYDLASINVAHYRNSADYEEACYILGQPTPVAIGLTKEWLEDVLKGTLNFGSRGGIPLPTGADAKLLQASENTMIKEAMEMKERQMVALGAKLVEQKQVQRTAFETKVEATSEGSVLSTTAKNVSIAYEWALKWCARLLGLPEDGIIFKLNDDFDIARMTVEEQRQTIDSWQKGAITFTEMRAGLRKAGVATEDDLKAKEAIAVDMAEAMALEAVANEPGVPT